MNSDAIIITGPCRSGVSMIAGVIDVCGAWGGTKGKLNSYDASAYGENKGIRDNILNPFLEGIKADRRGQRPLPNISKCNSIAKELGEAWRRRTFRIIEENGYESGPFYLASTKHSLIWPVWNAAFPDAKWVLIRRKDEDIVEACLKTSYMFKYNDEGGWQYWLSKYKKRIQEMIDERLNIFQIWPQHMINGDLRELQEMIDWLGLEWDENKIQDFVAPIVWRNGKFLFSNTGG